MPDYTPSRSRTPASESRGLGGGGGGSGGGSIRVHAQRIFTVSDDEVEDLLKTKVKGASKVRQAAAPAPAAVGAAAVAARIFLRDDDAQQARYGWL